MLTTLRAPIFCIAVLAMPYSTPARAASLVPDEAVQIDAACLRAPAAGTSGDYMRDVARCLYSGSTDLQDLRRLTLIEDLYIKSWSYAYLNKGAFWLAVVLAILVLLWPTFSGILGARAARTEKSAGQSDRAVSGASDGAAPRDWLVRVVTASSMQTSLTALAALIFGFYAHYKSSQLQAESTMRTLLHAEKLTPALIEDTIAAIQQMDRGFSFAAGTGSE